MITKDPIATSNDRYFFVYIVGMFLLKLIKVRTRA
jgi:hypothetical protein